ncbi:MAG: DUF4430 domain-containing protein [Eubacterium sp.]|nr:DUF4430 domain-containing protein [Eubacterium sp.]
MQKKRRERILSWILCMTLIVAMAMYTTGCSGKGSESEKAPAGTEQETDVQSLGEGEKKFDFTVVDADGNETQFEIHTDQETVGAALSELGVIEGEDSEYGLFVKTVNGITVDFDQDGKYWAFYVDGNYAESGVDVTPVTEGEHYSFQVE